VDAAGAAKGAQTLAGAAVSMKVVPASFWSRIENDIPFLELLPQHSTTLKVQGGWAIANIRVCKMKCAFA